MQTAPFGQPKKGEYMRVLLLVMCLAQAAVTSAFAQNSRIGNWQVTQKKDPITDEVWVIAQALATDGSKNWMQVRCEDKKPYLFIGIHLADFPRNSQILGALRIDNGQPTKVGFLGFDKRSVVTQLSRATYQKIAVAKTAAFKVSQGVQDWTLVFSLNRTSEAMKSILAACPISSAIDFNPKNYDPKESPTDQPINPREESGTPAK